VPDIGGWGAGRRVVRAGQEAGSLREELRHVKDATAAALAQVCMGGWVGRIEEGCVCLCPRGIEQRCK